MVVGVGEQLQVPAKLIMAGVVEAFDGGIFERPVHAIEQMTRKPCCWPVAIAQRVAELNTVVGQYGVQLIWEGVDQIPQELAGDHAESACPGTVRNFVCGP